MKRSTVQDRPGRLVEICMLAFFLTSVSYLPVFANKGWTQFVSIPVWGLVILLLLLRKRLIISRNDLGLVFCACAVLVILLVFQPFLARNYFSSMLIRCIALAIIMSFIGEMLAASGEIAGSEGRLFRAFIAGTTILCVIVYFTILRGQNLNSYAYAYGSKNETAVLACTAVILLLFYDWNDREKPSFVVMRILLMGLLTVMVFLMRCRSIMIGLVLSYAVFFFRKNASGWIKLLIVVAVAAVIFALQDERLYDTIVNGILFGGRNSDSINSVTSGRVEQVHWAMEQIAQNFWCGTGSTRTVDCFYVSSLMQFGVVLGACFILFSLTPLIWGLVNYSRTKSNMAMILVMCALSYSICAIFEENAPFGPGARCFMLWFLWGYMKMNALKQKEYK